MKITLTGATGFVGQELCKSLILEGFEELNIVTRNLSRFKSPVDFPFRVFEWKSPETELPSEELIRNSDVIIHLQGEALLRGLWTSRKKDAIYNSRVRSTENLLKQALKVNKKLKIICASAIGIYPHSFKKQDEESVLEPPGDFLSRVCFDWERAAKAPSKSLITSIILRFGVILSPHGGALKQILPIHELGLTSRIGFKRHDFSWIHIADLMSVFKFSINNIHKSVVLNTVSPHPISYKKFSKSLNERLGKRNFFPIPKFIARVFLGEKLTVLTKSQHIVPKKLTELGFKFQFPQIDDALKNLLKNSKRFEQRFEQSQLFSMRKEDIFDFFSEPKNLEKIVPKHLNFQIQNISTQLVEKGTVIDYKLKLYGFPFKWQTLISNWAPPNSFEDSQLKGPYSKWIHSHNFMTLKNSRTLMLDSVVYKVPFGFLGHLLFGSIIRKQIKIIFAFRYKVLSKLFKKT
jgi:uncharacterized protein (TIGR01777 family)